MHPLLSSFPSRAFYGGRLLDGVAAEQRPPPPGLRLAAQGVPVLVVDVAEGREEVTQVGHTRGRR